MDHHIHHQPPQKHPHHHQHSSHPMYPSNSTPYPTHHMISTPNYTNPNNNNNNRFPFTTTTSPPPQTMLSPPSRPPLQSIEPYSVSGASGGDGGGGYGGIDPNSQKKKRGRPRKYSPDNNNNNTSNNGIGGGGIALALSPTTPSSGGGGSGRIDSNPNEVTPLSDNSSKKNRGRPSGSSKKQLDALGNCGVGFTPHVILVNAGEDIASKIVAFSKQGARTVCVLSANGSVSNVDLRQPAMSGGVVTYEGRFEIISLSGSLLFSENSGGQVRTGGLSVSLAGTDGRVLGGGVVGALRAATPVQIIVGSFIADGKKPKYMPSGSQPRSLSFTPSPLAVADNSPHSQELSTDGSDDNGSNHVDQNTGPNGNSNHPIHHNMQMYSQMKWPNPNSKMLQN